jgi:translation initiation factor IF-3
MYLGEEVLNKFSEDLKDIGQVEKKPNVEGKQMSIIVAPLAGKK